MAGSLYSTLPVCGVGWRKASATTRVRIDGTQKGNALQRNRRHLYNSTGSGKAFNSLALARGILNRTDINSTYDQYFD